MRRNCESVYLQIGNAIFYKRWNDEVILTDELSEEQVTRLEMEIGLRKSAEEGITDIYLYKTLSNFPLKRLREIVDHKVDDESNLSVWSAIKRLPTVEKMVWYIQRIRHVMDEQTQTYWGLARTEGYQLLNGYMDTCHKVYAEEDRWDKWRNSEEEKWGNRLLGALRLAVRGQRVDVGQEADAARNLMIEVINGHLAQTDVDCIGAFERWSRQMHQAGSALRHHRQAGLEIRLQRKFEPFKAPLNLNPAQLKERNLPSPTLSEKLHGLFEVQKDMNIYATCIFEAWSAAFQVIRELYNPAEDLATLQKAVYQHPRIQAWLKQLRWYKIQLDKKYHPDKSGVMAKQIEPVTLRDEMREEINTALSQLTRALDDKKRLALEDERNEAYLGYITSCFNAKDNVEAFIEKDLGDYLSSGIKLAKDIPTHYESLSNSNGEFLAFLQPPTQGWTAERLQALGALSVAMEANTALDASASSELKEESERNVYAANDALNGQFRYCFLHLPYLPCVDILPDLLSGERERGYAFIPDKGLYYLDKQNLLVVPVEQDTEENIAVGQKAMEILGLTYPNSTENTCLIEQLSPEQLGIIGSSIHAPTGDTQHYFTLMVGLLAANNEKSYQTHWQGFRDFADNYATQAEFVNEKFSTAYYGRDYIKGVVQHVEELEGMAHFCGVGYDNILEDRRRTEQAEQASQESQRKEEEERQKRKQAEQASQEFQRKEEEERQKREQAEQANKLLEAQLKEMQEKERRRQEDKLRRKGQKSTAPQHVAGANSLFAPSTTPINTTGSFNGGLLCQQPNLIDPLKEF